MISVIYTVCALSNPACLPASHRTCVREHICEERIVALTLTEVPAPQICGMIGQRELAKLWDTTPDWTGLRVVGIKCADVLDFSPKEQEAQLLAPRSQG